MARLCSAWLHPRWYVRCLGRMGVVLGPRADGVWRMAYGCPVLGCSAVETECSSRYDFLESARGPSCIWSDTFIGSCKDG